MRGNWRLSAPIALLSLALVACGGGDGGNDDSVASAGGERQSSSEKPSSEEKAKKYKACLAERGVAPANGKTGEEVPEQTASAEEVEAALDACKEYAPTVTDGENEKLTGDELESRRKYVECLRENGYDAADPDPESGGVNAGQDKDLEKLKAAGEKCRDLNPASQN